MQNIIITSKTEENYSIQDLKMFKFENVISYKLEYCKPEFFINLDHNINSDNKEIYYILDCYGDDAFSHWVLESFIFYKNIIELSKYYPNLKILTNNRKKYVPSFLKLFNISNEIIYHSDSRPCIEQKIPNPNNICFFSTVFSLNDHELNEMLFYNKIQNFINEIDLMLPIIKPNKILFLPRNTVDNYIIGGKERIIYGTDDIKQHVIEQGGIVLDTYHLNNIFYQFTLIKNSEIIILDYGSSFIVNGLFFKNKKIIILNNYREFSYINRFVSLKVLINDVILKNNNCIVIDPKDDSKYIYFSDIQQYLS